MHAGDHHGLVGTLQVVTALVLSRKLAALGPRLRTAVGAYLALLMLYGLANIANDFWLEQIVKRGVTRWEFPSLITPAVSLNWLILLVLAALAYAFGFRRATLGEPAGYRRPVWAAFAALPIAALVAVGLAHGGTRHRTPLGSASGIVFAAAPNGTAHIYVTHGQRAWRGPCSRFVARPATDRVSVEPRRQLGDLRHGRGRHQRPSSDG